MLSVSERFKKAFEQVDKPRKIKAIVTLKNVSYENDQLFHVEYNSEAISGDTFAIGSTFSNNIKVTIDKVVEGIKQQDQLTYQLGIVVEPNETELADMKSKGYIWDVIEYVPMGTFFVTSYNPDRNENRTIIEASDSMSFLESTYSTNLTYPAYLKDIALDVANKNGLVVDSGSLSRLPQIQIKRPEKVSYRQVLGIIAQYQKGFATFDRQNRLAIRALSDPKYTVSTNNYFFKGLAKEELLYKVDGISCKVEKEDQTTVLQAGKTTGNQIVLENSSMTQIDLNTIFSGLSTLNYYPYSLKWRGNPALEVGDWISLNDIKTNSFKVPNLSYKLTFSGGLTAESSAHTKSISETTVQYRGPLNQKIEDITGWISAAGGFSYTGLDEPQNPKEKDVWFKPNGPDTEMWIFENGKWKLEISTADVRELTEAFEENNKKIEQAATDATQALTEANDAVSKATTAANAADNSVQTANQAAQNATQAFEHAATALNKVGEMQTDVSDLDALVHEGQLQTDQAVKEAKQALEKANGVETYTKNEIVTLNQTVSSKAEKTVVNTLQQTVDTQKTLISQNEQAISLKASQSTVNVLNNRVNVTESAIDINAKGVSSLVTKTDQTNNELSQFKQDFAGFQTSVYSKNETNQKISTVQQSVDIFRTTVETTYSTKKELADLQIGGTNLVKNGAALLGLNFWKQGYTGNGFELDAHVSYKNGTQKMFALYNTKDALDVAQSDRFLLEPDTTYTFSGLFLAGYVKTATFYVLGRKSTDVKDFDTVIYLYKGPISAAKMDKKVFTFKNKELIDAYIRIDHEGATAPGSWSKLYFTEIKLEKGDKATDWSPAIEDTTSQFTTQRTQIEQNNKQIELKANQETVDKLTTRVGITESSLTVQSGSIQALTTKTDGHTAQIGNLTSSYENLNSSIATIEKDVNGKASVTQFSDLNQTVSSLQGTVQGKADKTQLTLLENQFTTTVANIAIGANNLVRNGAAFQNKAYWRQDYQGDGFTLATHSSFLGGKQQMFAIRNDDSSADSVRSETFRLKKGTEYMFSIGLFGGNVSSTTVYILPKKDGSTAQFDAVFTAYKGGVSGERVENKTFGFKNNDYDVAYIRVDHNGAKTVGSWSQLYFTEVMLVEGNKLPSSWVMSSEDIATQSQITQLADNLNLRVAKNDVVNQINISTESILIAGKRVQITGQTYIENGVIRTAHIADATITDAKIKELRAEKITAGTLNAANVNIINLNANNITTGDLTGINITGSTITSQKGSSKIVLDGGALSWYTSNGIVGSIYTTEENYENFANWDVYDNGYFSIRGKGTRDGETYMRYGWGELKSIVSGMVSIISKNKYADRSTSLELNNSQVILKAGSGSGSSYRQGQIQVGAYGTSVTGGMTISGGLSVTGSKNAIHQVDGQWYATPAYETAESYLGDIGSTTTNNDSIVLISIDNLFGRIVNTSLEYQVFVSSYGSGHVWVEKRMQNAFVVRSSEPNTKFAWEIKAKRRGYEQERLVKHSLIA